MSGSVETTVRPCGPYSLRLSMRLAGDATRLARGGHLIARLDVDGSPQVATASQLPDGRIDLRAPSPAAAERLRFLLGLDDDHTEFIARFASDPLLGRTVRHLKGLRPLRTATLAHALLRALCGQLIETKRARALEARIVRAASPGRAVGGLHPPPTTAKLARFAPAELRALGLHARRAATLVRLCRSLDLERLHSLPTKAAADRLERERGLGPWSVGVICLEGLGRYERGLARDLGLIKLLSVLRGRWVEAEETDELLAFYGEWAGLASVYLLAGAGRGLIPLPQEGLPLRSAARRVRLGLSAA